MPKVTGYYHGIMYKDNTIMLRPSDSRDLNTLNQIFKGKKEREQRRGSEILLEVTLDVPYSKRSIKEINTAFKLITIIFESQNPYSPTDDEKLNLYYDLLDVYADRVPCTLYPDRTRPIHLSEATTVQAAHFIDGLLFHLSTITGLKQDLQADMRSVIYEWEIWRGNQKQDYTAGMDVETWRKRATYSEASGIGGNDIDLHHILTRGAHPELKDNPENWIALNRKEHTEYHQYGEQWFLEHYPHLEGRFNRAKQLVSENNTNSNIEDLVAIAINKKEASND